MPPEHPAGRGVALLPAFNESASIATTLRQIRATVPSLRRRGDRRRLDDDTAAVARAGGPAAVVLRLPFNLGIGGALRTGFRYAVRAGYDFAVQVDADGQHDPRADRGAARSRWRRAPTS